MKNEKNISNDFSEYERIINYRSELYINEYVIPLYGNNINGNELLNVIKNQFNAMLFYIRKYIPKINHDNLQLLDYIFNLYIELCLKYNRLPTIQGFSILSNISYNTLIRWKNGMLKVSPERINLLEKWFNTCKGFLADDLNNSEKTSVNKIFIAKSIYGINDNVNAITDTHLNEIQIESLPILSLEDTNI